MKTYKRYFQVEVTVEADSAKIAEKAAREVMQGVKASGEFASFGDDGAIEAKVSKVERIPTPEPVEPISGLVRAMRNQRTLDAQQRTVV
jgi:hypothetical protein